MSSTSILHRVSPSLNWQMALPWMKCGPRRVRISRKRQRLSPCCRFCRCGVMCTGLPPYPKYLNGDEKNSFPMDLDMMKKICTRMMGKALRRYEEKKKKHLYSRSIQKKAAPTSEKDSRSLSLSHQHFTSPQPSYQLYQHLKISTC